MGISEEVFVTEIVSGGQCLPNCSKTLFLSSKFSGTHSMTMTACAAAAMSVVGSIRRRVSRELLGTQGALPGKVLREPF
jgi:hypothetical protein